MDAAAARIVDANFNRAREALRVLEDHVRFGLDDAPLSTLCKQLRHDLAAVAEQLPSGLIALRDTPGDVGTAISHDREYERTTVEAVVLAAGKRLSEALRVIEEYLKIDMPALARQTEQLRYRGYDLERRVAVTFNARRRFADVRLYVLITEKLCRLPWEQTIRACAAGGAGCFQLREKDLSDAQLYERASQFSAVCRDLGVLSVINDRPDIAKAVNADGLHLGQTDLPVDAARKVLGPHTFIGVSTHSVSEAEKALAALPDYIAVGPMFSTALKPEYGVAGPQFLNTVREMTSLPIVAIGGITADAVASKQLAKADCLCVCTAAIGAESPEEACQSLIKCEYKVRDS